ncbi:YrzI family small protein [Bacillus xiapuensis]|nr:YrzI family small protein [Bacillus xiapuensis]
MTINLIFATITIKRRQKTMEDYFHEQRVKEIYEELQYKQSDEIQRLF